MGNSQYKTSLSTFVVTGASGYIGRSLVPVLASRGYEVIVVGRDVDKLQALYPDHIALEYDDLWNSTISSAVLINLAAMNNNQLGSISEFQEANSNLPKKLANFAASNGFARMIHLTSFHSESVSRSDNYSRSKHNGEQALSEIKGVPVQLMRLPAVYKEDEYQGRLSPLNKLPKLLRRIALSILSALRPVVSVDAVVDKIELIANLPAHPERKEEFICGQQSNVYRFLKRQMDIIFALAVIVFLWWALLLVALVIKMNSAGPALFKQVRVGQNQRPFTCYKFRTMSLGTEQVGSHMVAASAITRVGGFLRRTKMDELPQVWNLLKGELSLVGPRPSLPNQHSVIEWRDTYGIYSILPGITGLAQIQGIDMSSPEELAIADAKYMRQRNIILDVKIFIATIFGAGQGDRVVPVPPSKI